MKLAVYTNLATSYTMAARFREASIVLPKAKESCRALGDKLVSHQIEWLEGLIERGIGSPELAENRLVKARIGFVELGEALHEAAVSLDLAVLLSEQGREPEALELAVEMIPIFEALRIHREGIAALQLLQDAVAAKQVSLAVFRKAQEHLKKARLDPLLRFRLDEMKKARSRETNPDSPK